MRCGTIVLAAALVVAVAGVSRAQTDRRFTPLETAAACAPPPTLSGTPDKVPHVIGSQDTAPKRLFGSRDLLVVDAGTSAGMDLGQQFFVRRPSRFGMGRDGRGRGATTVGWVRVVAVNESTAITIVDQACGGIIAGDYLQPFVAPVLPPNADRDDRTGEPDFSQLARVVIGNEDRLSVGTGDFILIDRGTQQGLTPGVRFSVYRDLRVDGMPLASVGEGIVISTGDTVSVTRITGARDAVVSGDYVVLRK
jgi:hypothetical protein